MLRFILLLPLLAAVLPVATLSAAQTLSGTARVIDGDTLRIGEAVIRLEGIDAPEMAQRCKGGPRNLNHCGVFASDRLKAWIGGASLRCEVKEIDDYDRYVARCWRGDEEVSAWMAEQGLALAFRRYTERLVPAEERARKAGAGIWQTTFQEPWAYRARRWEVAVQEAPDGCPIKGNITRSDERIYHTPWGSRWYARTRISPEKGERWFCSEREAIDAGWRAPLG